MDRQRRSMAAQSIYEQFLNSASNQAMDPALAASAGHALDQTMPRDPNLRQDTPADAANMQGGWASNPQARTDAASAIYEQFLDSAGRQTQDPMLARLGQEGLDKEMPRDPAAGGNEPVQEAIAGGQKPATPPTEASPAQGQAPPAQSTPPEAAPARDRRGELDAARAGLSLSHAADPMIAAVSPRVFQAIQGTEQRDLAEIDAIEGREAQDQKDSIAAQEAERQRGREDRRDTRADEQHSLTMEQGALNVADKKTQQADTAALADPASDKSETVRGAFRRAYPNLADAIPDAASAQDLMQIEKALSSGQADAEAMRKLLMQIDAQRANAMLRRRSGGKPSGMTPAQEQVAARHLDGQLNKLSQRLQSAGVPMAQSRFAELDNLLPAPLDQLQVVKGPNEQLQLLDGEGKPVDLPGVSVPGLGRMALPGTKGAEIKSTFQGLKNDVIKLTSGAQVSGHEAKRLNTALRSGKFNTEAEMVAGMKTIREGIKAVEQELMAGFGEDVVGEYEYRRSGR